MITITKLRRLWVKIGQVMKILRLYLLLDLVALSMTSRVCDPKLAQLGIPTYIPAKYFFVWHQSFIVNSPGNHPDKQIHKQQSENISPRYRR